MSDGDDETEAPDAAALDARLDETAATLESADTEAALDEVEGALDDVAADLDAAEFPESDDDEGPEAALESRLADLRADLESQRGPYAEDVAADLSDAADTVADTRWTADGEGDLRSAVGAFFDESAATLADVEADSTDDADSSTLAGRLDDASEAVRAAGLDPDDDAEAVAVLADAAADLAAAVEAAETWDDLTVRETLRAEGFYEALGEKHKDFPPEWSALKQWEQRGDAQKVLVLLEEMGDSEFIEGHCYDALERMGDPDALDEMLRRADRREERAVAVLGTIAVADDDVLETLHGYVDAAPEMATTAMKSLGQIGSPDSVEPVAQGLAAEDETVRSRAARTLGMLGDTRAVAPLADVLDDAEETDTVRASAAWALVQIGTERALERAAAHADDRSYIVEAEAERAATALGDGAETRA